MFGPRDLPEFGALLNSGALLHSSSSSPNDLRASWGSLDSKTMDIDEAMGTTPRIFLHAYLANLWKHTLRLEYGRIAETRLEQLFLQDSILNDSEGAFRVARD
eukprot:5278168-Alexandrium_andersonii.AAC.1